MGTVLILLFGITSNAVINYSNSHRVDASEIVTGSWACTTEAAMCPNGETVGRVPPYCQFAKCSQ